MNNNIIEALTRIETKLDAVIKAIHEYDDSEYGESSFETFMETWDEEELNKRMDIIGQNGNEGSHYVTNEEADEDAKFNDYGMRVVDRDKDNNKSTQPKQKQYYKNKRSKRAENKK
jgi:hypothetical protein